MPGPAPTPNVIRMLRGNPGKRRLRREIDPPREPEPPQPPAFLTGDAASEWRRVAPMLHLLGILRAAAAVARLARRRDSHSSNSSS